MLYLARNKCRKSSSNRQNPEAQANYLTPVSRPLCGGMNVLAEYNSACGQRWADNSAILPTACVTQC